MSVQLALWYIMEKTQFLDYDFSDEFIDLIKSKQEYDGLYDIIILRIFDTFKIKENERREIKTTNPYPLVQLIIDLYNLDDSIFTFEETNTIRKKIIDSISSMDINNTIILLRFELDMPINDHPITKKCVAFKELNYMSVNRSNLFKVKADEFEELYPGTATNYIKKIKTRQYDVLFPSKHTKIYLDVLNSKLLCYNPDEQDIIERNKHSNLSKTIIHHYQSNKLRNSNVYFDHLDQLVQSKSRFMNHVDLAEYLSCLVDKHDDLHRVSKQHRNYIVYKIKTIHNVHFKLMLICILIIADTYTNNNVSKEELNVITETISNVDGFVSSTKIKYEKTKNLISKLKRKYMSISILGYVIEKSDDECLICIEQIDSIAVKCPACKKKVGHINCMCKWIKSNNTCPNCRSTINDRLKLTKFTT